MHRTIGAFVIISFLALCGACSSYSVDGADSRAQPLRYDESVTGLMRYRSHMATLSGETYEKELRKVAQSYSQGQGRRAGRAESRDFQTLRMAIVLMNGSTDDAAAQYRRAEALLTEHLDKSSPGYFNKDYRALARFLLTFNREWQSINNELIVARVEKARIEEKIEQIKSIEMQMNSPGNNFH